MRIHSTFLVGLCATSMIASGFALWFMPAQSMWLSVVLSAHIGSGAIVLCAFLLYSLSHLRAVRKIRQSYSRILGWLSWCMITLVFFSGIALAFPRDWHRTFIYTVLQNSHAYLAIVAFILLWVHRGFAFRDRLGMGEIFVNVGLLGFVWLGIWHALSADPNPVISAKSVTTISPLQVDTLRAPPVDTLANTHDCAQCHADIVAQWSASAHRFASFANPFYVHALRKLERERGREATKLCAGCHDPIPLLAGVFNKHEPFSEQLPFADRGVTCLVCHMTVHADDPRGNGALTLQKSEPVFPWSQRSFPTNFFERWLVRVNPKAHANALSSPSIKTASFCNTCHKVGLLNEVTGWRFVRGFNDADAWQQSAFSHEVALPFGVAEKRSCNDCHMPRVRSKDIAAKNGFVLDHRFAAANTALAAYFKDSAWLKREQEMLTNAQASATPMALIVNQQKIVPLSDPTLQIKANELAELHVLVTAFEVGHLFPGGTLDSHETWVELEVQDGRNQPIARHGQVQTDEGPPDNAHILRNRLIDKNGEAIVERDAFRTRTVLYNHAAVAGAGEIVRFQFRVPQQGPMSIITRLWFRKFSRKFYQAVLPKNEYKQPLILLSEKKLQLQIGEQTKIGSCSTQDLPFMLRYIPSATLQGDTEMATYSSKITAQCGASTPALLVEARAALRSSKPEHALKLVDALASSNQPIVWPARMIKALALSAMGHDDLALIMLDLILEKFPKDREAHKLRARSLLRTNRPKEAMQSIDQSLVVDPEDASACYLKMLAAAEISDRHAETQARNCYERYREDETQRALQHTYRAANAHDDIEANPIHVHWAGLDAAP